MAVAGGDHAVRLTVSDTGPGIPEDEHQHVFEKFRQLDGSATREYQGTGLGLAITKELVSMLGGGISLTSTPDAGSTFVVTLPFRVAESTGRAVRSAR